MNVGTPHFESVAIKVSCAIEKGMVFIYCAQNWTVPHLSLGYDKQWTLVPRVLKVYVVAIKSRVLLKTEWFSCTGIARKTERYHIFLRDMINNERWYCPFWKILIQFLQSKHPWKFVFTLFTLHAINTDIPAAHLHRWNCRCANGLDCSLLSKQVWNMPSTKAYI